MPQVEPFLISDAEFETFLERHKTVRTLVPESNTAMRNSYLILDEYMRFLDNTGGSKMPSRRYSNSPVSKKVVTTFTISYMFPSIFAGARFQIILM